MKKIVTWEELGIGDIILIDECHNPLPKESFAYNRYCNAHVRVEQNRYRTVILFFLNTELIAYKIAYKISIEEKIDTTIVAKAIEANWEQIEKANIGDRIQAPEHFASAVLALDMFL